MAELIRAMRRRHPWAAIAALAALLVVPAAVWAGLQPGSPWPMFQRDAQHSGRSGLRGPDSWEVRWYYQTENSITASPALTNSNGAQRCYFLRWEDGPTSNGFTPAFLMSPMGPDLTETAHVLPAISVDKGQNKLTMWVTAAGDPDEDSIPAGDWRFVLRGASSDDDSATLFFKVYGLTASGQDRELLFETGQSEALTAVGTGIEIIHTITEPIDTGGYERLLVEVWADTDADTDITLTLLLWPYVGLIETSYAKPALFMGSTDGRFYAIAQSDGKLLWSYDTGASIESPAAIDDYGTVYVGNSAGLLYAFNLAGGVEWVYGDDPTLSEPPDEPIIAIVGGPAVSEQGVIYITTESGMVQAIDSADGGLLWTWPGELDFDPADPTNPDKGVPLDRPILTSPAIGSGGIIYVTRYDGRLYAIDPDGETLWWYEVPEKQADGTPYSIQSSPTVTSVRVGNDAHDLVLFGSHSGHLYAVYQEQISDTEGTLLWEFPAGEESLGPITSTPAVHADNSDPENPKTYAWFGAGNGRVYKVDVEDGTEALSRVTTADVPVRSSPCIDLRVGDEASDGYVYIGANDGRVYAWDLGGNVPGNWPFDPRGILAWQAVYTSGYPFVSSPCLGRDSSLTTGDNELLFIGGLDGIIYCLGPGEGGAPGPPPRPLPELRPQISVNKQRDKRAVWYNFNQNCPDVITYTLWINNRGEVPATITELIDEIVDEDMREYVQLASKAHGNQDCDGNPTPPDWDPMLWHEWEPGRWEYVIDPETNPLVVDARETTTVILKIETKPNLSRLNPGFETPIKIHDNPNLDPDNPTMGAWEPHQDPDDPNTLIFPGDNGRNEFDWGQHVCLDVRGVGNSQRLRNRATVHFTAAEGGQEYKMESNISLTNLGWMNRWLLIFRYDSTFPQAYPALGGAQAPTHYVLIDSQQSRGRRSAGDATFQWWNDKTDENDKHVLLVKVYLDPSAGPRTDPIEKLEGLTEADVLPMDVAKQQNRPWVPYRYTVRVLQAVALSLADYNAPPPPPGQPMPPALDPRRNAKWSDGSWQLPLDKPVHIHSPLDALEQIGTDGSGTPIYRSIADVNIGGTDPLDISGMPVEFNPGSSTGNTRVVIKNRSRGLPFQTDSGIRPGWPMAPPGRGRGAAARRPDQRNVVRWSEVDLLHARAWVNLGAGYDIYRENTVGQDMIRIGPDPFFEIDPGGVSTMMIAADIPKYLHSGLYLAPYGWDHFNNKQSTDQYRVYIDLNGNETWDPGEAFFQNEPTGFDPGRPQTDVGRQYAPLTQRLRVADQPLLRIDEDTIDLGKMPAGAPSPRWALLTLRNPGNTILTDPWPEIGSTLGFSAAGEVTLPYLEPSWLATDWLALNLTQPLSRQFIPAPVPLPQPWTNIWIDGYERPVTSKTPVGASEPAGTHYQVYDQSVSVPIGQPVGTYVGNIAWHAIGRRPPPDNRQIAEASDSATIKATVVEGRLPEGVGVGAGAELTPTAGSDPAGLGMDVVWSSNSVDAQEPPPDSAPYYLYQDRYDFTTRQWSGRLQVSTGTALYEDGIPGTSGRAVELAYLYPGLITGSDGNRWLAWSGTARRDVGGTLRSDNRVFLQLWGTANTVAFPALTQPLGSQDGLVSPQAWIQPVLDGQGQLNKTGVLIWSRGTGDTWGLRFAHAVADPALQSSWRGDQALYTSSGLAYSRDPVVLSPTQLAMLPESERALIHVLFTGFPSTAFPADQRHADICYARYDPLLLDDPAYNNGQRPFAQVVRERLSPDPSDARRFYTRHREWWIDWYASQEYKELEPPILWVNGAAWTGAPDSKTYDRQAGLVTWMANGYLIQYSPSIGRLQFLSDPPPGTLELTYTPCLLRLTDSRSGDAGPAALLEWPRYRGQFGEPYPLDPPNLWAVRPRLWLFWRRTAAPGLAPRLYYKSLRHYIQQQRTSPVVPTVTIPARLAWLEEIRPNTDLWKTAWQEYDPSLGLLNLTQVWSLDVPDSAVPADVQIEDIGIAAAKDPSTSSVWLFWSSLRTPVEGNPAQPSNDIFYQAFNPAMPDALIVPQQE